MYPRRAGSQSWQGAEKALRARLREGHKPDAILAGVRRYFEFCDATGKVGTEYVKQASSFLGRDLHFTNDWAPPARRDGKPENGSDLPTLSG